ncbi:Pre-mRNA-splicing factor CWC24 [Grifola frondosa]|uniref:Pre-mRNA-splicing factor CWC24 n=1 Tax=Grifola frondosa TaxID=5627 RepID=A0A1C7M2G6_GRIFR|nr:Pre-mRNA-splicing factor CWC24 [Grifola frondosa]
MASTEGLTVPFFKKKGKGRPTTSRKRSASPPSTAITVPFLRHPSLKSSSHLRQEDEYGDEDAPEKEGPDVKWTAGSHVNAALEILQGDEAEELLAKRQRRDSDAEDDGGPEDGLYRGQKAYKAHIRKNQEVPKAMRVGPQRANNSTIRTVTIVDYQPDVCKDYKETGYCGYGDTCKFLHDRGTYLSGWQLDKLAANPKKQVEDDSGSDSDEDIPFACLICRKSYTDPIVTRCGHYFCSACAIKRFAKTPKCAACGAPTAGIFNRADKVIAKLKKTREPEDAEPDEQVAEVKIEGLAQADGEESEDQESDAE